MSEDEKKVGATQPDSDTDSDDELTAMRLIVAALKPLQEQQQTRVLEYVLGRFGAVPLETQIRPAVIAAPTSGPSAGSAHAGQVHDIRTLKETKNPRTASEMSALVAYYVSEIAPAGERRVAITKADIEKYFKSGGFKLPADAAFTLVNAKNAGYLDGMGGGQYKLNPVGYNLVAHRMGSDQKKKSRRK